MTFKKTYTDDVILDCISREIYRTANAIAQKAGCSPRTVVRALPGLEADGLVNRITVEISEEKTITAWIRC